MNSYKTLAAAAHISGIPVRYAVSFGQAWHARQDRKHQALIAYSLSDLVHEATLGDVAKVMDSRTRSASGWDLARNVGKWNAEDKERQLKLAETYREERVHDSVYAPIPRRDYGAVLPKFLVAYYEAHDGFEAGWFVVRALDAREWDGPYRTAAEATRKAVERESE